MTLSQWFHTNWNSRTFNHPQLQSARLSSTKTICADFPRPEHWAKVQHIQRLFSSRGKDHTHCEL